VEPAGCRTLGGECEGRSRMLDGRCALSLRRGAAGPLEILSRRLLVNGPRLAALPDPSPCAYLRDLTESP